MLHIVGCSQIGVRLCAACNTVRLELADEQQHLIATPFMTDITLAGRRIIRCRALALPMEQALVDGVVVVRLITLYLIQSNGSKNLHRIAVLGLGKRRLDQYVLLHMWGRTHRPSDAYPHTIPSNICIELLRHQ